MTFPLHRILVTLVCLIFVSACGVIPGLGGGTPKIKPDKPIPLQDFDTEARVDVQWSKQVGKGLGRKSVTITPAIVADRIVVADAFGFVEAFDRFSGKKLWSKKVGTPLKKNAFNLNDRRDISHLSGGVGAGQGKVFVGTIRGEFIALDVVTGEMLWQVNLSSEILAPATVWRDLVVLNTNDGKLFALDHEDGEQVWVYTSQDPIITLRGTASPVVDGGIAYSGFASGLVAAIDLNSGALMWDQRVSDPEGTSELDRIVDVDGRPLVTRQVVFAGSHQGAVRAIRRSDGSVMWEAKEPTYHSLASGLGLIFVVNDNSDVVALDENSGQEVWRQSSFIRRGLSDPIAIGNYLLFGDLEGYVHAIAQSDGRLMARRKVASGGISSPFVFEDDMVYCLGDGGKLVAFEIKLTS
ncbi:MAG: outer membrane protein assembly factor BamB [Gammaproteobacteria bacterium]|nr:outer membrane protein assembly factor BamB [Gammaproteobacteria bacterium]